MNKGAEQTLFQRCTDGKQKYEEVLNFIYQQGFQIKTTVIHDQTPIRMAGI